MTSRDFCYWLQGFFEVAKPETLPHLQVEVIKAHLALVFKHEIDPSIDKGDPAVKKVLDAIHSGQAGGGGSAFPPLIRC